MFENLHLAVINSAMIYVFVIVGIRMLGKKELGQLSVTDLIFIMLISNAVGDVMRGGNETIMGGVVAGVTIMVMNKIFKYAIYKFPKISELLEGIPSIVIRNGVPNHKELKRNQINVEELEQAGRGHGIGDISKIKLAVLEKDGSISILDNTEIKTSEKILE